MVFSVIERAVLPVGSFFLSEKTGEGIKKIFYEKDDRKHNDKTQHIVLLACNIVGEFQGRTFHGESEEEVVLMVFVVEPEKGRHQRYQEKIGIPEVAEGDRGPSRSETYDGEEDQYHVGEETHESQPVPEGAVVPVGEQDCPCRSGHYQDNGDL